MYRYSEADWPIFRVFAPSEPVTDKEFEEHLAHLTRVLERRQPHVLLIQLAAASWLSMERRDKIRLHSSRMQPLAAVYQRGIAVVVPSAIQRAMASAVLWLARPACPSSVFSDSKAADIWAIEQLAQPVPVVAVSTLTSKAI